MRNLESEQLLVGLTTPVPGSRGSGEDQRAGERKTSGVTEKIKGRGFSVYLTPLVFNSPARFFNGSTDGELAQTSRKHQRYRKGHGSESCSSPFVFFVTVKKST